jgi:hypothetical protein
VCGEGTGVWSVWGGDWGVECVGRGLGVCRGNRLGL